MGRKGLKDLPLDRFKLALALASTNVERNSEIVSRRERNHCIVPNSLRTEYIMVEPRIAQLAQLKHLVGEHKPFKPSAFPRHRPGILHVALLIGAVTFLVQSAVEIKIDLFGC